MFFKNQRYWIARCILIALFLVSLLGAGSVASTYAQPLIYRVTPGGATSSPCGADWSNPCDLQALLSRLALQSANAEIWVAAGTYTPTFNADRTISFVLKNGVALYGGFSGVETSRVQRNFETNVAILSGDIGIPGDSADNSYHVVKSTGTNYSAVLDGFTVTAGNANGETFPQEQARGGGLYNKNGSPSIRNVIFTNNYAHFGGGMDSETVYDGGLASNPILVNVSFLNNAAIEGGGMRNWDYSSPTLINVNFDQNTGNHAGGGLANGNYSNPSLSNVTFSNNTAGDLGVGGGISNWSRSNPSLVNVTFQGNTANSGGGMYNDANSSPHLNYVTFSANSAQSGGGISNLDDSSPVIHNTVFDHNTAINDGGGIYNLHSSPNLTDVNFNHNSAMAGGGGMFTSDDSYPVLNQVLFNANEAKWGGAIFNGISDTRVTNTTFYGNIANDGGAILNQPAGAIRLTNVTITENTAVSMGGVSNSSNSSMVDVYNSIVYANAGGQLERAYVTYSIVEGGYPGTGNLDANPLLESLADNGGFTQTMALGHGSPAIDSGDDTICPPTDQRGMFRPEGSSCDIGAVEYASWIPSYTPPTSTRIFTSTPDYSWTPSTSTPTATWPPTLTSTPTATPTGTPTATGTPSPTVTATFGLVEIGVHIHGQEQDNLSAAHGQVLRVSYPGISSGPVRIMSRDGSHILGSEAITYKMNGMPLSFSEMMGLPNYQLDTTYWLPWYNNVELDTQLRFGNVSSSAAQVHVYIAGQEMVGSPFSLSPGESTRKSFPGVNNGPVRIESNVEIVAAERVVYKVDGANTSFTEMMALPSHGLDTTYWLPWYNNVDLDTQLRIANPSASTATVYVYIGGQEMVGSPFVLAAGASTRKSFAGVNSGPVKIVSNQTIVAAERVIYKVNNTPTSFSETMALPNHQLDTSYWLPWYNNTGSLNTQLRFANVSGSTATVQVFINGVEMTGSPFTLAAGESTRKSFAGVNNGPVQVVSNQSIVVAERIVYKANNTPTSFSEVMALPNSSLDSTYWLPWYNNAIAELNTQLQIAIP